MSVPVVILISLILTGRYGALERKLESSLELAEKDHQIDMKKREIEHLQNVQDKCRTIRELKKELIFERELSEHKLKILALQYNIDWMKANDELLKVEDELKEKISQRENLGLDKG